MARPKKRLSGLMSFINNFGRERFPQFDAAKADIGNVFRDALGAQAQDSKSSMAMLGISLDALINAGMTDADIAAMNFNSAPFKTAIAEYGLSPEQTRKVATLLEAFDRKPSMELATQLRDSVKNLDDPEMNQLLASEYFRGGQLTERGNRLVGSVFSDPQSASRTTGNAQDIASAMRSRALDADVERVLEGQKTPIDAGESAAETRQAINLSLLNNPVFSASKAYRGPEGAGARQGLRNFLGKTADFALSPGGLALEGIGLYKLFGGEDKKDERKKRRTLSELRDIGEVRPAPPTPEAMRLMPMAEAPQAAPTQKQQLMQELNNMGLQAELYRERQMRGFLKGLEDSRRQAEALSNPQPMLIPAPRVRINTLPIGEQ